MRFARSGQRRGKRSRATCRSLAGQLRISFTDSRMSDEAASQLTLSSFCFSVSIHELGISCIERSVVVKTKDIYTCRAVPTMG